MYNFSLNNSGTIDLYLNIYIVVNIYYSLFMLYKYQGRLIAKTKARAVVMYGLHWHPFVVVDFACVHSMHFYQPLNKWHV